jgi:hypothetical protein
MLTDMIEHVSEKDFAHFEAHPHDCMRMRLAEPAEIARVRQGGVTIPSDVRHTTFVIRVAAGKLILVPTALSANVDPTRLTEAELYQILNGILLQDRGLERRLVAALVGEALQ